jgi:hypothetical protein
MSSTSSPVRSLVANMATMCSFILIFATPIHSANFSVVGEGDDIRVIEMATPEAPAAEPEPEPVVLSSTLTVAQLAKRYTLAFREEEKDQILQRLGQVKPKSGADITWLLNLFNRDHLEARRSAELSMALLSPRDKRFSPYFLRLLNDSDPFMQMFGLMGMTSLQEKRATERIQEIADQKFKYPQPQIKMSPTEANAWRVQYQALSTLGEWDAPGTMALMVKRSKEAPPVASLLARFYWEKSLPKFVKWTESRRNKERGLYGLKARIPVEILRKTTPQLEEIVRNKRRKKETRRLAALQLGFALTGEEVQRLIRQRRSESDEKTKLMLTAAIFASRSPQSVPLLINFVKKNPSATQRAGALYQLGKLMPPLEFTALLKWVIDNDPDQENRSIALKRMMKPE